MAWPRESLMVTFAFRCNIACAFCMVEDVLTVLPGTSLEEFRAAATGARLEGVSRIIFSGGEVTLSKELPAYAELARSLPGIEHVRIQTNATRLAKGDYLRSLLDAGIDEYFVSFHAPDAPLYDRLVDRDGSFERIMEGMANVVALGGALSTNTAIVAANHDRLSEIVERVAPLGPRSMEMWNYWPRADADAERAMAAPVGAVQPHLLAALAEARDRAIPTVVKWFPKCLLGEFASHLDDAQPPALIDDEYWTEEPAYSCLYEGVCVDAGRDCSGLSHSYVRQHGWEERRLRPFRASDGHEGPNAARVETRSLVKDARDKRSHAAAIAEWLALHELAEGATFAGFELRAAMVGRGVAVLILRFGRAEDEVEIRVHARDERRAAFARTASFNVVYARTPEAMEREVQALAAAFCEHLDRHDPGGRGVPG